ncbi:MAG: ABC transporter permease [Prevotella sp.]|nr:ABC transporter permease [Prevotella sp.]
MNFPLFVARKIYSGSDDKRKVSRPAIQIATLGVAIGLAVMIITVSVVMGFKHTIRDKVIGFGSHIQIENLLLTVPAVELSDSTMDILRGMDGVSHVQRYATAQGILKTDSDFLGTNFKGVGEDYDTAFLARHIIDGRIPRFSATKSSNQLMVSKITADKLHLKAGDRIFAYFITDNGVKARKFDIAAVYQTNMTKFDELLCFTDLYTTRRLNGWEDTDIYSGAEMTVSDFSLTDVISSDVAQQLQMINATIDNSLHTMSTKTIFEAYPQIFTWLELLDLNVWIILALMVCVAGFTMISGLLIIILERTRMIGILKALGARNKTIRHTFLWFAAFIIGQGLFWGNLIGVGIVLLQQHFSLITLDPATYYVKEAPMELNLPVIVALNVATMAISIFVLIAPSYLISFIHPAKSMRYE